MAITRIITPAVNDDAVTLAKMASGTDGNIISYDTSGNPVAVATGNDGQVLTSAGAGAIPTFEALPAGGKILQVVTATDSTSRSTTSSSYTLASSSLTANITPSASSSKIFVMITAACYNNTNQKRGYTTIFRNNTNLSGDDGFAQIYADGATILTPLALSVLDSPSSTSQVTYQIRIKSQSGSTMYINEYNSKGSITLFEIGA